MTPSFEDFLVYWCLMKRHKKLLLFHLGLFLMIGTPAQEIYNLWENQSKPFYKENNLQEYEEEAWGVDQKIRVEPRKGWLLYLESRNPK